MNNSKNNESKLHPKILELRKENKNIYDQQNSKFRKYLEGVIPQVGTNLEEIADGLGISRQTTFDLFKEDKPFPRLERFNLINLWEVLSDSEIYLSRNRKSKLQENHILARNKLRKDGSGELLSKLGFSDENMRITIDNLDLPKDSIERIYPIISRLPSKVMSNNFVWKIENSISEQIEDFINSNNTDKLKFGLGKYESPDQMLENMKQMLEEMIEFLKKIENCSEKDTGRFCNAIKRHIKFGKKTFNSSEVIELFYSIKQKTKERQGVGKEFTINILSCEIKSLDFCQQILDSIGDEPEIKKMILKINLLGSEAKQKHGIEQSFIQCEEAVRDSITKEVQLDCIYFNHEENCANPNNKKFSWVYRSNDTNVRNILNAITRGMGIKASLEDLKINTLSSSSDSLIKVSCIVKFNDDEKELYRGNWVDMDILTCISQSFICACEQWIKKQNIEAAVPEMYYKMHQIYGYICDGRNALYAYRTNRNFKRSNIKPSDLKSLEDIIEELEKESTEMKEMIYGNKKIKLNFPYLVEFINFAIQYSDLLKIRSLQINGLSKCAKKSLSDFKKNYLIDGFDYETMGFIKLMHKTEEMLSNVFQGNCQMIYDRLWCNEESVNGNNRIIDGYIQTSRQKNHIIHTTSFYYALSEYYGNWSRLEFYFCGRDRKNEFEKSLSGFLEAAYFSLQNDNAIRFSYWLCHAARSSARIGNISDAKTILQIAEAVIDKTFNITDNFAHKKGIKSIYYLVKSEISLYKLWKKDETIDSDKKFAKVLDEIANSITTAIFGFYVIGFERLIFDSIYILHKLLCELEYSKHFFELKDEQRALVLKKFVSNVSKNIGNIFIEENITDTILIPLSKVIIHCNCNDEKSNDDEKLKRFAENIDKWETNNSDRESLLPQIRESFLVYSNVLVRKEDLKVTSKQIESLSEEFKNKVKDKWSDWFEDDLNSHSNEKHPICTMIDSDQFLSPFI
jgi:hypothetical protein